MTFVEILKNILESALYAFCSADYIELQHQKKYKYVLLFTVVFSIIITALNYITFYEGFYIFIPILAMAFLMYYGLKSINSEADLENALVYSIIWNSVLSVSAEITLGICFSLSDIQSLGVYLHSDNRDIEFYISRLLVLLILYVVNRMFKKYKWMKSKYEKLFVCVFILLTVGITGFENMIYTGDSNYRFYIFMVFLLFALSISAYYIYCSSAYDHYKEQQATELALELKNVQDFMTTYSDKEEELKRIRHDLRNQFAIIQKYVDAGEAEEVHKIIKRSVEDLDTVAVNVNSGYAAIDAIVSMKMTTSRKRGIETKCFIDIPGGISKEQEYDIAIIIGNLLDNAIENNIDNEPYITLDVVKEELLTITVQNPTKNKDFKTRKENKAQHGIGLKSVRYLANLHHGKCDITIKDGICTANVTMFME